MNALSLSRMACRVARERPELLKWYLANRWRASLAAASRHRRDGYARFPSNVSFRLTTRCNLHCPMCRFVHSGETAKEPEGSLAVADWGNVIEDIAPHRPYVTFSGGEPTLYGGLTDLIAHASARGLHTSLVTNGTTLAAKAKALVESGLTILIVSVDGPAEVHDSCRGAEGTFRRLAEGIAAVQRHRSAAGSRYPTIAINSAITAWTWPGASDMPSIAAELGVDALNFQHQWAWTQPMVEEHNARHGDLHPVSAQGIGVYQPPEVDLNGIERACAGIRALENTPTRDVPVFVHPSLRNQEVRRWYRDPQTWVRRRPTLCAWLTTEVLPNGDVESCVGYVCGNVRDEPLTRIWNGPRARAFRSRLHEVGDLPICRRCCVYFRRD